MVEVGTEAMAQRSLIMLMVLRVLTELLQLQTQVRVAEVEALYSTQVQHVTQAKVVPVDTAVRERLRCGTNEASRYVSAWGSS